MDDATPKEANTRLATLLGWTKIFDVGALLMGTPPSGAPASRNQAVVPDWCGDWRAAGPLVGQFGLSVAAMSRGAAVGGKFHRYTLHAGRDAAIRYLVVLAATARLEALVRCAAFGESEDR